MIEEIAVPPPQRTGWPEHVMNGVKKFPPRGNLVDRAVAFVIGAAFAGVVTGPVVEASRR
jgi:hypothetical protein